MLDLSPDTQGAAVRGAAALHQPPWEDQSAVLAARAELSRSPALVDAHDVRALRSLLAAAADGHLQVLQAGDCAEDPADCSADAVARKTELLGVLAAAMCARTGRPVLRVGRIAGQFAKPRSAWTETVDGAILPVFRGHLVNSPEPDPELRRPDPRRLVTGYRAARSAMTHLGWYRRSGRPANAPAAVPTVWTSHEALLLDYEVPQLRHVRGDLVLTSTHWPWVGKRTCAVDGAHVAMLAGIVNPVACKVGPDTGPAELVELCATLDPERSPGRLTLIARMGVALVEERLPALVAAVRAAGHPVIWLTDPMHGNTVTASCGRKTRNLDAIRRELVSFQDVMAATGGIAGGVHLETTPDDVTECAPDARHQGGIGTWYTSSCDPRLNPRQAVSLLSSWGAR